MILLYFVNEDKYKNYSGIYKIVQLSTNKVYIGQTRQHFIRRYWLHAWKLNNNCHDNQYLQNAWNKYGENDFVFEVVKIVSDFNKLNDLEIFYINKFDTYKNGFNLTTGGDGCPGCPVSEHAKQIISVKNRINNTGKKASKETREKMKKSSRHTKMSKEHHELLIKIRTGSKHSEESKKKMSISHLGSNNVVSVINEEQVIEIKRRLMNGERQTDIAKSMGVNRNAICAILSNRTWKQVIVDGWNEFLIEYEQNKHKKTPSDKINKIENLLNENYTCVEIAKIVGVNPSVVYRTKKKYSK